MPKPFPLYEIFVYSPQMEGIHLRGGMIARGGIRWSDRREDFRTEVLGLMKAQMVKNAVIVPVGVEGRLRAAQRRRATGPSCRPRCAASTRRSSAACSTSPTTSSGGRVQHPEGVRCYDGDDTYLVVAADKGTAALSDVANGIAIEYGFWLGDAFASGGSSGYDHKALGITARGAWESVKRHFRELGHDIESRPFTRGRASATCRATCSATGCCSRPDVAGRRVRPPPRVPRPEPGHRGLLRRAAAAVRPRRGHLLGGLRPDGRSPRAAASSRARRSRSR